MEGFKYWINKRENERRTTPTPFRAAIYPPFLHHQPPYCTSTMNQLIHSLLKDKITQLFFLPTLYPPWIIHKGHNVSKYFIIFQKGIFFHSVISPKNKWSCPRKVLKKMIFQRGRPLQKWQLHIVYCFFRLCAQQPRQSFLFLFWDNTLHGAGWMVKQDAF